MLDNKVILITGASRGIGRAVAKTIAAQGARLILLSRNISELESLATELQSAGYQQPLIYPFNLCSATLEDYDDLRRNIDNAYGQLDGLILNAGMLGDLSPIEHHDIKKWYQVLQVNLNSVFILTQATLPLLKKSAAGTIIFTDTELSSNAKANWGAYAVASAGCNTMMQMLAKECANLTKIRVNAIRPAKIQTRLRAQAFPAEDTSKLTNPENITKHYLYLLSNASRHLNGVTLQTNSTEHLADFCII